MREQVSALINAPGKSQSECYDAILELYGTGSQPSIINLALKNDLHPEIIASMILGIQSSGRVAIEIDAVLCRYGFNVPGIISTLRRVESHPVWATTMADEIHARYTRMKSEIAAVKVARAAADALARSEVVAAEPRRSAAP